MAREQATLEVPWFERLGGSMGARAREFPRDVRARAAPLESEIIARGA